MSMTFSYETLTETQKEALFAFGTDSKVGTCCNLIVASSNCEGQLTGLILMTLATLIEQSGLTEEEFAQIFADVQYEISDNVYSMEQAYEKNLGKKAGDLPWRSFARKKMLAAFGSETCGETVRRLDYIEHVTADPDLKQLVHELRAQVAEMNVFHPEKYPKLLAEARKVDELWRLQASDLGLEGLLQRVFVD